MAITLGTNAGFVSSSPSGDPNGPEQYYLDDWAYALKDTSPSTATKITEIGWYCDNATETVNFEVAIYADDAGRAGALIGSISSTNAKGTGIGWKKVTGLNITISSSTIYWIAVQLDNTTPNTFINAKITTHYWDRFGSATTLSDPFGGTLSFENIMFSIYAVWSAPTVKINKAMLGHNF